MVALAPSKRKLLERALQADMLLERHRHHRPSDYYEPHEGQLAFHSAIAPIRLLFPGNGWGKTTAIGCEVDAWIQHSHRWRPTPDGPVTVIWFCPDFRQYEILKAQIEETCLTRGYVWKASKHCYVWPDGSRLFLVSADRNWTFLQGINPHLIVFDEQPPLALWREMLMRRRGRVKTEFCIAATATQGITWMADLHDEWEKAHLESGIKHWRDGVDITPAMREQVHPRIWCWPKGGIYDNPGADQEDVEWYESTTWASDKEKKVRLQGGFENWVGDPVFDEGAVDWMRREAAAMDEWGGVGTIGSLVPLFKGDERLSGKVIIRGV